MGVVWSLTQNTYTCQRKHPCHALTTPLTTPSNGCIHSPRAAPTINTIRVINLSATRPVGRGGGRRRGREGAREGRRGRGEEGKGGRGGGKEGEGGWEGRRGRERGGREGGREGGGR